MRRFVVGKRRELPSQRQVEERIDIGKKDMQEKETDLDKIASDVEKVRQTITTLDFGGTAEGTEQLESSIEKAEDVTASVFDKENEELEQIQDKGKEYETEIEERETTSNSDLEKISSTSAKINTKETINELVNAKEAVLRDIDFLSEQIKRAKEAREKSDATQRQLEERVNRDRRERR
jgi:chromosome segregation ATPase